MKLEAVNGNLMTLTVKVPPAEEEDAEGGGGDGEAIGETIEEAGEQSQDGEVEKEVVGKKKGTRKKRSLNWEEAERALLVEVIKPKVDFVENRNVDSKSIKAKRLAWMQITKQFNLLNFRHRSLEQIQVQWRSMKNSAKREHQTKHPKSNNLEGMDMIEFMEEMQKEPSIVRSQTRGSGGAALKRELTEMDDEDTPLAALPASTNASDDASLQTSTLALPSPPPSAESQTDTQSTIPSRNRKKTATTAPQKANSTSNSAVTAQKQQQQQQISGTTGSAASGGAGKSKRQRNQNSIQSDTIAVITSNDAHNANFSAATLATTNTAAANSSSTTSISSIASSSMPATDDKYKKQLFELMKRARLAEMEYARREHEQKLRLDQMEQDLKLNYYRKHEDLKLRQLRDEHEIRMRHCQSEHEARMRAYTLTSVRNKQSKAETNDAGSIFN